MSRALSPDRRGRRRAHGRFGEPRRRRPERGSWRRAVVGSCRKRNVEIKTNERNGSFDLQSHRGGHGEWTEESLAAFANSLKLGVTTLELGVTTLELDTHLTEDDKIVVWHDNTIQADKCLDTAPATAGDPEFPYVGDRVAELSLAQVKTLKCGFMQLPGYAEQDVIEGNRIAELKDVYQLVRGYGAKEVRFNVETKVEDGKPGGEGMVALTKPAAARGYDVISPAFRSVSPAMFADAHNPTSLGTLMEKRGLKLPKAYDKD